MSNFTVGLAILGGLVLAAIIAHGAWTSRRNAPRQAEPDVHGVQATRVEPGLGDGSPLKSSFDESSFDAPLPPLPPVPLPSLDRKNALDALIDVLTPIALDAPVSGDAAIAALPHTRRAGSKPIAIEGLSETRQWEAPVAGRRYSAFQAGVQMANRTGALNEIEFSEFVVKVQAFADALSGSPEFPDMLHEVARARELDQFSSTHDAQLGFTLRARSAAWSPGYIQQNAARVGFVAGAIPGRLVLPARIPNVPPLLGLSFDTQAALADDPAQSAVREMTLSLDVPQVPRSEQPFVRMREAAIALAAAMDGIITDDNGHMIRADGLDVIGSGLEQLYDTLDQRDLSAGSPLARRLFS